MHRTTLYRTFSRPARARLREKGSRFLAFLEPCADRDSAEARLAEIRSQHHDATHVCWAWRFLSEPEPGEASSDAGEPAGSAGVPMLGVLQSYDLWNVLGIVVRWYGGTKLGKGGLARTYRDSLAAAVENGDIVEIVPRCRAMICTGLENVGDLHRLLSTFEIDYLGESVEGEELKMEISAAVGDVKRIESRVNDVTRGRGSIEILW